ncbi:hypothetical protein BKA61DRAFT_573140 [Leptodontidium sp. MPI-SDFR-AT-0119]|nr:hypothetical protein BKA61DRAFT_573140 [Leptodontidium sp. MPI-SDFR-AT-0119]
MDMDSMAVPSELLLKPAQQYSSQEWEQKRSLITKLYQDSNKTLYQIRLDLAQQGFRPTEPMLKKRIKKWDLDRKNKHADMIYAVRVALERERVGKQTNFLIRGRVVTFAEAKNFFRRKGIRDLQALVDRENHKHPTTEIRCHTPIPSAKDDATEFPEHSDMAVVLAVPPNPQNGSMNVSATRVGHQDLILSTGRTLYDAVCVEMPSVCFLESCSKPFKMVDFQSLYYKFRTGHSLLEQGSTIEAFQHFNHSFDLVPRLLRKDSIMLLPCLYQALVLDCRMTSRDIVSQLLVFISHLMNTLNHPSVRHAKLLLRCSTLLMNLESNERQRIAELSSGEILIYCNFQRKYPVRVVRLYDGSLAWVKRDIESGAIDVEVVAGI